MNSSPVPAPTPSSKPSLATSEALRTVLQITEAVSQAKDVAELVERALDAIVAYTRFPCCGLFRLDSTGTRAELLGHRNVSPDVYASIRSLPLKGSLTGLAIQRRSVVTSTEIAHDPRIEPNTREALAREGYLEAASIPLIYQDRALGTVNLIYHPGDTVSDAERETLLGIGQTIAIALANRAAEDEQHRLEEQVRKTEQLERLGLLAGGLAHDFNNFLTCIVGSISLGKDLLRSGSTNEEIAELLDSAERASRRAAGLVQRLLTFSKGGAPVLSATTRLGSVIRESAEFSVHGSSVRLAFDMDSELATVEIDAAQISRMIQNLVINAVQASPEGGTVTIAVKNESPRAVGSDREWIRISITDQGSGIAPEILPRIFEPYFTTKSGGSGLGLPTVRSIVVAHGGTIEATSELGAGTTLLVRLPTTSRQPVEREARAYLPPDGTPKGRALVMDDDPAIRSLAQRLLEREGYEVEATADGDAAIRACEDGVRDSRPFDLALLDLTVVGGRGGRETVPRLRALLPNISVVVCSGYSEDAAMATYAQYGFDGVLPKPYTIEQFAFAVRAARHTRTKGGASE